MPGGTQTTNTTQTNTPWPGVKKLLNMGFRDAQRAYKRGVGSNRGSNVVQMADDTVAGNDEARRIAEANMGGEGTSGQYQRIIGQGGYNDEMRAAVDKLKGLATGPYDPKASGFEDVLKSTLDDAQGTIDENAAAMGRYGSGAAEEVRTRELGDISNRARYADFQDWMNRRDNAISGLGNLGQAGIGNLQTAYEGMQSPVRTRLGIGSQFEDLMRRTIEDRNRAAADPWNQINRLIGVAGAGSPYASSSGTTVAPGPNPLLSGLGATASGLGILGALGIL